MVFEKINNCLFIQIAHEKSYDYVLIIYMKKYEIAYQNYAEKQSARIKCKNNLFV